MKFLYTLTVSTMGIDLMRNRRAGGTREIGFEGVDRRYAQLKEMFTTYNPLFDERKFWTYGCNCLMLGDRPMSDPGLGPPVDALDGTCKQYKDCNKCVQEQFGKECIQESTEYSFISGPGSIQCTDEQNTCKRALCECDAKFANQHARHADSFDPTKHAFESDWDPESSCPASSGGGSNDPQCCSNSDKTSPFILYNALHKECCYDGQVRPIGQC